MSKERLIKRLKWYYPAERFHAFVTFPLIILFLIFFNPIHSIVFIIYGLLVGTIILYQGQYYWHLKLKVLMGETINQKMAIAFFRKSKKLNILLFILMPLFFLFQLMLQGWDFKTNKMLYWGLLANVFAILEHVNYYHTQLMIDNKYDLNYVKRNKRLKKASLAKDLNESRI